MSEQQRTACRPGFFQIGKKSVTQCIQRLYPPLVCLLLASNSAIASESKQTNALACEPSESPLIATYQIEAVSKANTGGMDQSSRTLTLWREGGTNNRVAHSFEELNQSELWSRTSNGFIRVVKHFDEYQRAIEYEPVDIGSLRASQGWYNKYYLLSPKVLSDVRSSLANDTIGSDCLFEFTDATGSTDTDLDISWNVKYQLPQRVLLQPKSTVLDALNTMPIITWKLISVDTNETRINDQFAIWDSHKSTDFVDIGDNENDPFLRSMIALGFLSHGASGFYDNGGSQLGYGHGHLHY